MKERELIKIDRNGTKHYRSFVCPKCGGKGTDSAWQKTGWYCYKCGGTGVYEHIEKEYTPEYLAKQAEKNRQKQEKKIADTIQAYKADMTKAYREVRFNDDGKLYAVVEPNSYYIKEELKADGAKWRPQMNHWTFTTKPEKWQTVEIDFSDCYYINQYGVISLKQGVPEWEFLEKLLNKKGE